MASEKKILEKERRQSGGKWGWGESDGRMRGAAGPLPDRVTTGPTRKTGNGDRSTGQLPGLPRDNNQTSDQLQHNLKINHRY